MSSAEDFGSLGDFESEEIGVTLKTWIFMQGLWSVKNFVFVVSFSLSWVIGNIILLKGVEVILRKLNSKWCSSPNPTPTQSFEWSHWKSHISSVKFLQRQRRRSSGLWGIFSDWGVRNSPVRIAYKVRNMTTLRNLNLKYPIVAVLCASCPKITYPHNGHIIEGHLCLIMSGCSLGYK